VLIGLADFPAIVRVKAMFEELEAQLRAAGEAILASDAPKKIVVAGPGTGKTYLFRQILERIRDQDRSLVLTFINNLKNDLEQELGQLARVFTFHGYCRHLLHQRPPLRRGLSERFKYFPPLASLVKRDWEVIEGTDAPQFTALMRELDRPDIILFYLERADYYDAVGFDDSVFRIYSRLLEVPDQIVPYITILVDEYQDFNRLEAAFIDLLASRSPTLIAGDDDQALYSMRSSSPRYIREAHAGGDYQPFPLPFCMRCTEPVVAAANDVIMRAQRGGSLVGRIAKPYLYYPPKKGPDSERYPRLRLVEVSVQSLRVNYFGRYIEQQIQLIPAEDVTESRHDGFPTVLIIGPRQYLRQVANHLRDRGYPCSLSDDDDPTEVDREDGLRMLHDRPDSNLGWRVVIETDNPPFAGDIVRASFARDRSIIDLLPPDYRDGVLREVRELPPEDEVEAAPAPPEGPTVRLASFEGSKGLSAQHVFILGLQEGDMPRNAEHPSDIDICKFLVALTRTRKQCHLLYTWRWSGQAKRPSLFVDWIDPRRFDRIRVDRNYW
jgi:superfamily I DNA/RNA helicase